MIRLNENGTVRLSRLKPEMDVAMYAVEEILNGFEVDTVITAGTEEFAPDGRRYHSVGSYHPRGYALDFRSSDIPKKNRVKAVKRIRTKMRSVDAAYDVIFESDHIHVEFDLKKAFVKGEK